MPSTSWPPDDFASAKRKSTSTEGMDGWGIINCLSEDDSQKSHTSSSISNQKQWAVRLARVFSVPDLPKELNLNILSRKVPNLKGYIFSCGPFCRIYKRSTNKTRWSDHQMLAVLEVADSDFWIDGSNSLSAHCHFPVPSPWASYLLKMKGFEQERRSSLPVLLFHSQCCRTNTDEDHDDNEENNNEHWSRWRCSSVLPRPLRWDSGIPRHKGCVTLNFN